ncbi:ral guanine nucleotide dissociation stimulator-like [Tamandua tetradactyla]|uniref:ral guanine nucleotide dissociation stimulator-like n=1 Tax=Tamandua tetradactyla TaxID=48850 RepID=UPI0040548C26
MPSVELQSVSAVTPPGDHSCSSCGHQEQGLREGKATILVFRPRLLAEQLSQIDVPTIPHLWTLLSELASLQLAPTDSQEECKVVSRIKCLQEGCTSTQFWPMEEFKAWFGAMDHLRESEWYDLSCEREPLALLTSNTLDAPNLPDVVKPRCTGPQELSAEPSCSGASLPSVWLQLGHDLSSGVAAVSLPGREAMASQAHVEMSVGLISTCPDGQEKQVSANFFFKFMFI